MIYAPGCHRDGEGGGGEWIKFSGCLCKVNPPTENPTLIETNKFLGKAPKPALAPYDDCHPNSSLSSFVH